MNRTQSRIIDALSKRVEDPVSIRQLTSEIKKQSGSAYYSNTYRALMSLRDENVVRIQRQGKAMVPSLDFENYLLLDILVEIELQKKREFLQKWPEAQLCLASLDEEFGSLPYIRSVILTDPAHNMKLNRAELIVIIDHEDWTNRQKARDIINDQRKRLNIRIEGLVVTQNELIDFLKSGEKNPIRETLSEKIAIYLPQSFWNLIRNAYQHGIRIRFDSEQTNPSKIRQGDLAYNLARFGYKELGSEIRQGQDYSTEYTIASILMGNDARRTAAASILIAKNRPNLELVEFLSMRHGFAERLLGILEATNDISPNPRISDAIASLRGRGTNPSRFDEGQIRNIIELYGLGTE